jgi:predicted ATPase
MRRRDVLTELNVRNFRSFPEATLPLRTVTVLYGANGSGKSTLLDALNMLSSFVTGARASGIFPGGVFSLHRQRQDREVPLVQFAAVHETSPGNLLLNERIEYSATFQAGRLAGVSGHERLSVDGELILESTSEETQLGSLDGENADAATWVTSSHRFARRYRLDPQEMRQRSHAVRFISPRGGGLPSSLDYMREEHPEQYERMMQSFLALHPDIGEVEVVQAGNGDLEINYTNLAGRDLSGAFLSDGQVLSLGSLFLAFHPSAPKIMMMDEPEVGLSPVLTQRLLSAMCGALVDEGRQLLATTHSPYVLRWGIVNGAQVNQVHPRFGTRTWVESLHSQGIVASTFHNDVEPISITHCCALLETYLAD